MILRYGMAIRLNIMANVESRTFCAKLNFIFNRASLETSRSNQTEAFLQHASSSIKHAVKPGLEI